MHYRRTRGIGPSPCQQMLVSDYPGRIEAIEGLPLVGKTGKEVNRRLDGLKLPERDEWFISNLIREWNPSNEYTHEDVARDEHELVKELAEVAPTLVVTLGRWSARWFLGDVNLDEVQALPWVDPQDASRVVFPITNPAAGFRSPEIQAQVDWGFRELGLYFAGKIEPREIWKDEYPNPTYIELTDPACIRAMLHEAKELHIDTEGSGARPWSVQFATQPGTAYLIRASHEKALRAFFDALLQWKPRLVFHGSLHDFGIFRALLQWLGYPVESLYEWDFDDTQIMAYLLQLEPIGLKPNCVRHCSMVMQDYTEVLGDAQLLLSQDYLVKVFDAEQVKYAKRQQEEFERINSTPLTNPDGTVKRLAKTGDTRYRKISKLPDLPKSDLHKAALRVLASADPFKLWGEQREDIRVAAYNLQV